MALALLYDFHGNLPALEAVLEDARRAGAERWLLGGDYAAFGGWPAETVTRLEQLEDARWLRGNVDRWLADDAGLDPDVPARPALAACVAELGDATVARLVALPERLMLDEGCCSHASPLNDLQSFGPEPSDDERLLDGVGAERFVFGHTHVQFVRPGPRGSELVNPGSVGIPLDGDRRAAYALIGPDGAVELRRVEYDFEAAARRIEERFDHAPWTATFARRIRTARVDG